MQFRAQTGQPNAFQVLTCGAVRGLILRDGATELRS